MSNGDITQSRGGDDFADAGAAAPAYKLYSPGAVGLATFLGSPVAGAVVMAMNYRRLGRGQAALVAVALGIVGTLALLAIGYLLPNGFPSTGLGVAGILAMMQLAKSQQGSAIDAHQAAGGQMSSNWWAAGIGLLCGVAVLGGVFAYVLFGPDGMGTAVEFGKGQEVYYSGDATDADARTVGDALRGLGFFSDDGQGRTVLLSKDGSVATVSFVTGEDAWSDAKIHELFRKVARTIGDEGLGLPIDLRLLDEYMEVKWETRVE